MTNKRQRLGIYIALGFLSACTSFDRKLYTWIGTPIKDYLSVGGRLPPEEIRGPDAQGHRTYVARIEKGENCIVYWDVDADGIIRGWKHEGSSCKHYTY